MKPSVSEPPGRPQRQVSVLSLKSHHRLPQPIKTIVPAAPVIYRAVEDMVHELRPSAPVTCLRPATIVSTAGR